MTIPRDAAAAAAASSSPSLADNPTTYLRLNLIPIFFLLLGVGSALWMFTFNVFLTRSKVVAFLRTLSVSGPRARKAFTELKRKSFHLMGLLIPSIWYLGLHYSNGLITRPFGIGLLGAVTAFIWVVELLRWISPVFRGQYNRLFSSIMRKHELVADAAAGLVKPEEGSLAHTVDELVKTITTPLLGELPGSPSERQVESNTPYLRSAAAAAGASSSTSQTASQFSTPAEYNKFDKPGVSPRTAAAGAPPKIESEKIFTGMPFFLSGMWLSMVFFTPTIATCAMLFLILGDMSAAICGISWGTIKIGRKSLEGTVAMFIVCYVIGSIFFFSRTGSTSVVFIAALAATLVELLGPADKWWGDDNITIPLTTGIAFTAAFKVFTGSIPE